MRLRELIIRQAKLPRKPQKLFDGGGLFIYLTPSGKYWYYKYRCAGQVRTMALGKYPQINLKAAREAHMADKMRVIKGNMTL